MNSMTLTYVHDPMCSWCWGFRPVWARTVAGLPEGIGAARLLGGLAPDTGQPMPQEMRAGLEATWQRIARAIPGTEFNFDFWRIAAPRRATYPACRAVIAARWQGAGHEEPMIHAIQRAYYTEARNPSETSTLLELAAETGLDVTRFSNDLASPELHEALLREVAQARALDVDSYPSLVLVTASGHRPVPFSYTDPDVTLGALRRLLDAAPAA